MVVIRPFPSLFLYTDSYPHAIYFIFPTLTVDFLFRVESNHLSCYVIQVGKWVIEKRLTKETRSTASIFTPVFRLTLVGLWRGSTSRNNLSSFSLWPIVNIHSRDTRTVKWFVRNIVRLCLWSYNYWVKDILFCFFVSPSNRIGSSVSNVHPLRSWTYVLQFEVPGTTRSEMVRRIPYFHTSYQFPFYFLFCFERDGIKNSFLT